MYTPEDGHRWDTNSLCSTTKVPCYLSHQSSAYIHTSSLLVTLHVTNKVSVIKVIQRSWFVFCVHTCVHFHHVIKVTIEFCSPSKFSRWLPFVCCPQLHILLFPQCKPPIPINQLTFIIKCLRASVTLLATYLILLAIKPKPTNDFTIYGGITNSFAIFAVRMLQKLLCVVFHSVPSYTELLTNFVHWQYHLSSIVLSPY